MNFKLKHPDLILPFGNEPDTNLHWFGLTDSEYWLSLGDDSIYEYSKDFRQFNGVEGPSHVDYYLSRLAEDLMELFPIISEPIPDPLYDIVKNYSSLSKDYNKHLQLLKQSEAKTEWEPIVRAAEEIQKS